MYTPEALNPCVPCLQRHINTPLVYLEALQRCAFAADIEESELQQSQGVAITQNGMASHRHSCAAEELLAVAEQVRSNLDFIRCATERNESATVRTTPGKPRHCEPRRSNPEQPLATAEERLASSKTFGQQRTPFLVHIQVHVSSYELV